MKGSGKFFKCFASVTEPVFLITRHLGKCVFVALWNEHGVIAESLFTLGFKSYTTFDISEKSFDRSVRKSQSNTTNEPCSSFFIRNRLHAGQKFVAVFYRITFFTRISRGIYSGRTVKGIHFETRVIGKGGLAGALTNLNRFLGRIALEGVPVFNCFGAIREIIEGKKAYRQISNDPQDLFDLLFISSGEYDFHGRRTVS
jgi:hypothetical protein